jgi:hypothetical protein
MKRYFVIVFIALANSITAYSQHPFKQDLEGVATITFPDTTKVDTISTGKVYILNYNNTIYWAQHADIKEGVNDLLSNDNLDSTYNHFITGVLKGSKGKIIYKNNITINGLYGVELGFTTITKGRQYYCYQQTLYLNDDLISYSVWSLDSLKKDDKKITGFFKTFKLTINKDDIRQSKASKLGYKFGYVVGILLIIGIVVLLGFGVVYIIKKITYK